MPLCCGWKQPLRQQMLLLLCLPRQRCSMLMSAAGVGAAAGSCIISCLRVVENHQQRLSPSVTHLLELNAAVGSTPRAWLAAGNAPAAALDRAPGSCSTARCSISAAVVDQKCVRTQACWLVEEGTLQTNDAMICSLHSVSAVVNAAVAEKPQPSFCRGNESEVAFEARAVDTEGDSRCPDLDWNSKTLCRSAKRSTLS